jgi:hypothetical protein
MSPEAMAIWLTASIVCFFAAAVITGMERSWASALVAAGLAFYVITIWWPALKAI